MDWFIKNAAIPEMAHWAEASAAHFQNDSIFVRCVY
jgi:hypothetical protein